MSSADIAQQSLESILEKLGFTGVVTQEIVGDGLCLQISNSPDAELIIGDEGDRLDDLQYIVNRMTQKIDPETPRVRVDCDNFRANHELRLVEKAISLANRVIASGAPMRMTPLNAYHRRLVHNALQQMDGIRTESPNTDERFKRITILKA